MFFNLETLKNPIWLTGFWGFEPEEWGALGFTLENDRDRFRDLIPNQQMVCIYGASSGETSSDDVARLLGLILVENTPIDSWQRLSASAKKRNIEMGESKWRFALPVRRAWRTTRSIRIADVFPQSYDPSRGRYIAKFGTWLAPDEADWLRENLPLREVNVFGEPPAALHRAEVEKKLQDYFTPSKAILGAFGERKSVYDDKPHVMYLATIKRNADLIAGEKLYNDRGLFKIGVTGDPDNRLKALNISFPTNSTIKWEYEATAKFPDRASAVSAEDAFKASALTVRGSRSLGREFFIMRKSDASSLFGSLSTAAGLILRSQK